MPRDGRGGEKGRIGALRQATQLLAAATIVVGVALLVATIRAGGGVVGYLLGALFVAAGAGRLYLLRRR